MTYFRSAFISMAFPNVRFYSLYWPLKWPMMVGLCLTFGIYSFVQQKIDTPNYTGDVTTLYAKIIFSVFIMVLIVAFCLVGAAFVFNRFNKRKQHVRWNHHSIEITQVIQPLLGYVRLHLLKEDALCSECIQLFPSRNSGLVFLKGTMVSSTLDPSDLVRAEKLTGVMLHYEDPFRFFSLSYYLPVSLERLLLPTAAAENTHWIALKHPNRDEQHTNLQQRKAGEWFHLKSFESGDDVRRIVWKLYAHRKEWMVRQQDQQHPYGDTLQIFISFHTRQGLSTNSSLVMYLETTYKQRLYALIRGLLQEGMLLDCQLNHSGIFKSIDEETLAAALSLATFVNSASEQTMHFQQPPSLIFFSSLDDASSIQHLMHTYPNTLFVQVDVLNELHRVSWLSRLSSLWLKSTTEHLGLKQRWWRHPMRPLLIKNNKTLHSILVQHGGEGGVYV